MVHDTAQGSRRRPCWGTLAEVREDIQLYAEAGLTMAFKLMQVAEGHWRGIDAAELVPLVRAGVVFEDGVQIEPQQKKGKKAAA